MHNHRFLSRLLSVGYLQGFTVGVVDVYERREAAVDGDPSADEGPQSVGVGDPDPEHLGQSKWTQWRGREQLKYKTKPTSLQSLLVAH